jgi:hypothetical protein
MQKYCDDVMAESSSIHMDGITHKHIVLPWLHACSASVILSNVSLYVLVLVSS